VVFRALQQRAAQLTGGSTAPRPGT
jgi:hypothetical protein